MYAFLNQNKSIYYCNLQVNGKIQLDVHVVDVDADAKKSEEMLTQVDTLSTSITVTSGDYGKPATLPLMGSRTQNATR